MRKSVQTQSRQYRLWKGPTHGGLLSSPLFNALLQHTVDTMTKDRRRNMMGSSFNVERKNTHLSATSGFADDAHVGRDNTPATLQDG